MALGNINSRLQRALAANDIPAQVAMIAKLAAAAGTIRVDDYGLQQVMNNVGQAITVICRDGSPSQLSDTIAACRQSADSTPSPLLKATFQAFVGTLLAVKFNRTEETADLDAAIGAFRQAADNAPETEPVRANYLDRFARLQRVRSALAEAEREDKLDDQLRQFTFRASEIVDQAIEARDPAALTAAMGLLRQARDMTQAGDPLRPAIISEIGVVLRQRFELTGALAYLDEAIATQREAVEAASDDTHRVAYLSNLANVLRIRFERSWALADLNEAAEASRQAFDSCAADDPRRPLVLSIYGLILLDEYRRSGRLDRLDDAVTVSQEAVAKAKDEAQRAPNMMNLGLALTARFERTGDRADMEAAVTVTREALHVAGPADRNRSYYLTSFASALWMRGELTGSQQDLNDALAASRGAAEITAAAPRARAGAAILQGHLAVRAGNWPEAVRAYHEAINLLEKVVPRGLPRGDQEFQLIGISGVASHGASCCLELGQADLAVELLEQGRGVLLGQALDRRTDLTALEGIRPELAVRYAQLCDQLDAAQTSVDLGHRLTAGNSEGAALAAASWAAEQLRQNAESLDAVITEVRSLPELERFLLPPRADELLKAAEEGPVVMINVDEIRSDALVLTPSGVRVVSLPGVSATTVANHTAEFLSALGDIRDAAPAADDKAEARLTVVLGWLWDTVAGPVLEDLGLTGSPAAGQPLPRIWWCPSGLLSLLPLHAAGHHETRFDETPHTVIDRVVSSYAATARTLLYARRPVTADAAAANGQVLVVAMAHTPGASDLNGAPEEASLLTEKFGGQAKVLHDEADAALATSRTVLDAMPGYSWAHFVCHGAGNLRDPSTSYLLLDDHASQPLTVLDVARLRLQQAELAYLSACSTAMTGATLPDEAINLASAFQLAGYRRVIATLWPVDDDLAASLARRFYNTVDSANAQDAAAQALHDATRLYRGVYADQPSMWAAYIHAGI